MKHECQRCDKIIYGDGLYCSDCRKYLKTPVKKILKPKKIHFRISTHCVDCEKEVKSKTGTSRCKECYMKFARHYGFGRKIK